MGEGQSGKHVGGVRGCLPRAIVRTWCPTHTALTSDRAGLTEPGRGTRALHYILCIACRQRTGRRVVSGECYREEERPGVNGPLPLQYDNMFPAWLILVV